MWKHSSCINSGAQDRRIRFLAPEGLLVPEVHIDRVPVVEQVLQSDQRRMNECEMCVDRVISGE